MPQLLKPLCLIHFRFKFTNSPFPIQFTQKIFWKLCESIGIRCATWNFREFRAFVYHVLLEVGKISTRLADAASAAVILKACPALSFCQTWRSEEEGSDVAKVKTFVIFGPKSHRSSVLGPNLGRSASADL